jgi:hypothetical protein
MATRRELAAEIKRRRKPIKSHRAMENHKNKPTGMSADILSDEQVEAERRKGVRVIEVVSEEEKREKAARRKKAFEEIARRTRKP